jgi:hypothetical protein
VNVASVFDGRDLDAGDRFQPAFGRVRLHLEHGVRRVVVGRRHDRHAGGSHAVHELARRAAAVGGCGVKVKIDHRAPARAAADDGGGPERRRRPCR